LIELNLVAGANFALGWIWKWHPGLIIVPCLWVCLQGMRQCGFIWTPRFNQRGGLLPVTPRGCCLFLRVSLLEPTPCGRCRPNYIVMYGYNMYSWYMREFLCSDFFVRNMCSGCFFICSCICRTFMV
jgi:hypothetical protein